MNISLNLKEGKHKDLEANKYKKQNKNEILIKWDQNNIKRWTNVRVYIFMWY